MGAAIGDAILDQRGATRALDAYVVGAAFDRAGAAAFALGDGTVSVADPPYARDWRNVRAHDGAVLSIAAREAGFLTGGDDGKLCVVSDESTPTVVKDFKSRWVEHAAAAPDWLACSVGKDVHVFDAAGHPRKSLAHPSTVSGLVFDAKGKRVAASHYNGASLWFTSAKVDAPRVLEWKGSHTGIVLHPEGEAVVTSMQENALHGWRLSDGQHMRMTGYPGKTAAMSFTRNGRWLATSGADSIVLWPFFGGGPMGKPPAELAGGDGVLCTSLACHPKQETCAAGFADGLVVLADIPSARVLQVAAPGRGAVTAVAWSRDGAHLAFGTEGGFAAVVDFTART